jgi:glycolate oxidase FAD binding subunit
MQAPEDVLPDGPAVNEHRPAREEDLAEIVRRAAAERRPLRIIGGGTRDLGHPVEGEPLHTDGLAGIRLYEPGALTIVAGAGTPLADVEAALAAEGQRLPFEPWDGRALYGSRGHPTIGGAVAVNASGPRRIQVGACRDSLIGIRFVDGTGQVIKSGGRVMKNVTGLDLVKLLCGSHGTLGILTEVAFKVLPRPETTITLVLDGLDEARAVEAMTAAMATPYEVTGAAHVPKGLAPGPVTLLRVEGFAAQAEYRARQLAAALARWGEARLVEGEGEWPSIRDARLFSAREGDVWRFSVRPTDGARVTAALRAIAPATEILLDWAGGLVWALVPEHTYGREALKGIGGHATLMRAAASTRGDIAVFHPEPAPLARIASGLRARFDPSGILNPGRMTAAAAAREPVGAD